jgi:hypothetical protein
VITTSTALHCLKSTKLKFMTGRRIRVSMLIYAGCGLISHLTKPEVLLPRFLEIQTRNFSGYMPRFWRCQAQWTERRHAQPSSIDFENAIWRPPKQNYCKLQAKALRHDTSTVMRTASCCSVHWTLAEIVRQRPPKLKSTVAHPM